MSTKKLGVLALVGVLVIGAVVIGVLLMVRPAEEAPPARDVEAARPAEEAPPAPEVEAARPAEEAPPAEQEVPPPPEEVTAIAEVVHFSRLVPFLPEALSGWVAEKPYGTMMTLGEWRWSMANRYYTKPGTDADAFIEIIDSAYHVGPWAMWAVLYEYEDAYGYLRRTTFHGFPAWEEHIKPNDYHLHINIGDRFLVVISVHGRDRDTLYAFADRIDYRGIAALE